MDTHAKAVFGYIGDLGGKMIVVQELVSLIVNPNSWLSSSGSVFPSNRKADLCPTDVRQ